MNSDMARELELQHQPDKSIEHWRDQHERAEAHRLFKRSQLRGMYDTRDVLRAQLDEVQRQLEVLEINIESETVMLNRATGLVNCLTEFVNGLCEAEGREELKIVSVFLKKGAPNTTP